MKFINELNRIRLNNNEKKISIIIGDPVNHSLSPVMHTKGYESLNIDNSYCFDKITVKKDELHEFINDLKVFNNQYNIVIGLTCTMPHKENIIQYVDKIQGEAKIINAVNSVVINNNIYTGYNTDWYGIERPFIERNIDLQNKKVAIIGAGGASRSAIYAFKKNNCIITIFNRTKEKADLLANEFQCLSNSLDNDELLKNNDIIINTTNVGMGELIDSSPVNLDVITNKHIVFDCIYKPQETKLIKKAKQVKAEIIFGWEMLLYQGVMQFELYTNKSPNIYNMRSVL